MGGAWTPRQTRGIGLRAHAGEPRAGTGLNPTPLLVGAAEFCEKQGMAPTQSHPAPGHLHAASYLAIPHRPDVDRNGLRTEVNDPFLFSAGI